MRTIGRVMNALTLSSSQARNQGRALQPADFAVLADFRHELRRFALHGEAQAQARGLAPQQHQALLAIKASPIAPTVTELAHRLCIKTTARPNWSAGWCKWAWWRGGPIPTTAGARCCT